jgi:2-isopropylmalate synthase
MKFEHGLDLPRRLQIELSSVIQRIVERTGTEITAGEIWSVFAATYLEPDRPLALAGPPVVTGDGEATAVDAPVRLDGAERQIRGRGHGPAAAFADALTRDAGLAVEVLTQHAQATGEGAEAVVCVEARVGGGGRVRWGVGRDASPVTAAIAAVVSAVNRA